MQHKEIMQWQRWNTLLNALLVLALCLIVANMAWAVDTQDILVKWRPVAGGSEVSESAIWSTNRSHLTESRPSDSSHP